MAELRDVMAYLLSKYPHPDEMSNARVTKCVYLADWKHAIEHQQQMTPIRWKFDNFGPFVWDIKETAEAEPDWFTVTETANYYGKPKTVLGLADARRGDAAAAQLTADEKAALDHVIEQTKGLHWDGFIKLVYSTHPIMTSARYTELDLAAKAAEYRQAP